MTLNEILLIKISLFKRTLDDLEVKVRGLLEVPDQLILNKEFTKEYQTKATLKVYKELLNTES